MERTTVLEAQPLITVTIPDQADEELLTLPQYCDAVGIHGRTRRDLILQVDAAIDRMLAAGETVKFPFRLTRWGWYNQYNLLMARDERETMADVRAAGHW